MRRKGWRMSRAFRHLTYVTAHSPTFSHFTYVTAHSHTFRRFTYVTAHSPTFLSLHLRHSSFFDPSVALPTSQLILQPIRCFTYVTVHSPTLLSLLLRHRLFSYVTWRAAYDAIFFQSHGVLYSQDSFTSTFRPRLWDTSLGVVVADVFAAEPPLIRTLIYFDPLHLQNSVKFCRPIT